MDLAHHKKNKKKNNKNITVVAVCQGQADRTNTQDITEGELYHLDRK